MRFIIGDATQPQGEGNKIIIHCCNDIGAWGAGFVMALSSRWENPEASYRHWFEHRKYLFFGLASDPWLGFEPIPSLAQLVSPKLGEVDLCKVENDIYVANIIGQRGVAGPDNQSPVVYDAIRSGVKQVQKYAELLKASVHMPRMGCGLAGGEWSEIEKIINEELEGIDVTVYDFPDFPE